METTQAGFSHALRESPMGEARKGQDNRQQSEKYTAEEKSAVDVRCKTAKNMGFSAD